MAATEPARRALYSRLQDVLGPEYADTLMTYLPRDAGDQVASKADIARLEARFESRFDGLETRMTRLEDRFDRLDERFDRLYETIIDQQKYYARTTVWSMVGLTAIFSLVATFLA